MSDNNNPVENPVDNSSQGDKDVAADAVDHAEEAVASSVDNSESEATSNPEEANSTPVEIITEGGSSVHAELKPETSDEAAGESEQGARGEQREPVGLEETEGHTPTTAVPTGDGTKILSKRGLKFWLTVVGGAAVVGGIIAVTAGLILGSQVDPEKKKALERAANEKTAEQVQEIVDNKDLDQCDNVTDSVEGEPAGKWCELGEFRAFIPN